ncbi:hypothetical protein H0A36_17480 [Endozoicomonas sp. SM1973]|uniref:Uncharacterized protein n=1 Tax=Spartinivicinus marinus TaxID=2994442 RepID=A0A853IAZ9_9GAMM|nr:DUF6573 family protein [Spartinivicinus marinus]MCX4030165.1 hypothetical protein [Spartinivicinus marinus]NYZ67808.1 hypothetical protein [Spartinivicinus marinus]
MCCSYASAYTRRQAIEDGVLIDVTKAAAEVGFKFPVALTRACYEDSVGWTQFDTNRHGYQDEAGRLWDVLNMLYFAISSSKGDSQQLLFQFYRVNRTKRCRVNDAEIVTLKSVVTPGDLGEPVITIMLPEES